MSTLTQLKGARDLAQLNHSSHKSEQSQAALDKAESDLKTAIEAAEAGEESTDQPNLLKLQAQLLQQIANTEFKVNTPANKPAPINTPPAPPAPKVEPIVNPPADTATQDGSGSGDSSTTQTDANQPGDTTNNGDSGQSEEKKSE